MKHPNNKHKIKNNSISNLIKFLIWKNIAKNWISKLSPDIPMKSLIIKIKMKLVRWDPITPPGGNLLLLVGGWTHCFTILFSYSFSITTIKSPIVPNRKKPEVPHQSYCFIWGRVLPMFALSLQLRGCCMLSDSFALALHSFMRWYIVSSHVLRGHGFMVYALI